MTVILRPATEADYGYCLTSWVESWRCAVAPGAAPSSWREAVMSDIAGRMRRGKLVVACDGDDHDRLYGFASGKPGRLWYVYVRDTWRRQGIAGRLVVEVCGPSVSAATMVPKMAAVAARKGIEWRP